MAGDFRIQLNPQGKKFATGVIPNIESAMRRGIHAGMQEAGFLIVKTLRDGIQNQQKLGRIYKRRAGSNRHLHLVSMQVSLLEVI